jgi:hypothetical protein
MAIFSIHAIKIMRRPAIRGEISPARNVKNVILISGDDSVHTSVINGAFSASVSPGSWKLIIKTSKNNIVIPAIETNQGVNSDLGKIRLE